MYSLNFLYLSERQRNSNVVNFAGYLKNSHIHISSVFFSGNYFTANLIREKQNLSVTCLKVECRQIKCLTPRPDRSK